MNMYAMDTNDISNMNYVRTYARTYTHKCVHVRAFVTC
jgi:hypothetical protein